MPQISRENSGTALKSQQSKVSLRKQDTLILKKQVSRSTTTKQQSVKSGRQSISTLSSAASSSRKSSTVKSSFSQRKSSSIRENGSVQLSRDNSKAKLLKKQSTEKGRGRRKKFKVTKYEVKKAAKATGKKKKKQKKESSVAKPDRQILFPKGRFVAVRSAEADEPFYLARTLRVVKNDSNMTRIHWLTNQDQPTGIYVWNFPEMIEPECLICAVNLQLSKKDTYELGTSQRKKIERELAKAVRKSSMGDGEDSGSSVDAGDKKKSSKATAARKQLKKKNSKVSMQRTTSTKLKKLTARGLKSAQKKAKDEEKRKLREERQKENLLLKTNPNARLKPRPKIKVLKTDPFKKSRDKIPFISSSVHSKLVHRAVQLGDNKLLQQLVDDVKQVARVNLPYSVGTAHDPLEIALEKEDLKAIQILFKEVFNRDQKKKARVSMPQSILSEAGTGSYNYRSLGVPNIRAIAMSRGSREGNNAFTKDDFHQTTIQHYVKFALEKGVKITTLDAMMAAAGQANNKHTAYESIWLAVRGGHRKLAGQLMKQKGFNFNNLHIDSLLLDNEDMKGPIRIPSVRKKPWDNHKITPVHCAAINPNTKYMAKLLQVVPEYGITDEKLRRPIHFAAACEGPGPLEFLLKRGQDPAECDGSGLTPLMIACEAGRLHNVKVLLDKGQQDKKEADNREEETDEDDGSMAGNTALEKYGVGGVNRPVAKPQNKLCSYTPLHIAIKMGHVDIVEELLRHGVDKQKALSAGKDRLTPVMIACRSGHLDMCQLLYRNNCALDDNDKLKRSPLMHAVMCGHADITSYLLHMGVDVNRADSSGNTAIHYAAAYGWYHCLQLLLDAGAEANASNDWKTTALGIAFMKGHTGLADLLLEQSGVDIDFTDEKGMTLTALACCSPLDDALIDQIDYLVNQKNADCKKTDVCKNSPLHHLSSNSVKNRSAICPKKMKYSVQIATTLIKNGCDPSAKNEKGITPMMAAIECANTGLVEYLLLKGGDVAEAVNQNNQNILHLMANQCVYANLVPLLNTVIKSTDKRVLWEMVDKIDDDGFTPLLRACQAYQSWNGDVSVPPPSLDQEDDEEEEDDEPSDEEMDSDNDVDEEGMDAEEEDEDEAEDEEAEDEQNEEEDSNVEDGSTDEFENLEMADEDCDDEISDPTYKPGPKSVEALRDQQWRDAREFILMLIKRCAANVNNVVAKKKLAAGTNVPDQEYKHYTTNVGKFSALHFLINVPREQPVAGSGMPTDKCPALTMILKQTPNVDLMDVYGRTPLLSAIADKTNHTIFKLLEAGADVDVRSEHVSDFKATPLLLAAKQRSQEVMKHLIKHKANANVTDDNKEKKCPLHYIASHTGANTIQLLTLLLDAGADIEARTADGRTALQIAVSANRGSTDVSSEVEQFLIENGANVFSKDDKNKMPLHYVFSKFEKAEDSSSTDPIELCSTLTQAMKVRKIDEVDALGRSPLHYAALRGAGVCCMHLIQKNADINLRDYHGNSPLALSVYGRHESCTIMLLQRGADISVSIMDPKPKTDDATRREKKPAWQWAPLRKVDNPNPNPSTSVLQCVIKAEWQGVMYMMLDLFDQFGVHYTAAVEAALETGKYHLAMTFIRKANNSDALKTVNKKQQNLFHILASQTTWDTVLQERVAKMLLDRDVLLNAEDQFQCTPLHYACLHGNTDLLKFLCENGTDLSGESPDQFGRSALAAVFWKPSRNANTVRDMLRYLKKIGGRLDCSWDYPSPNIQLFGHKMQQTNYDYHKDSAPHKVSPLILAIKSSDFALAKVIIEEGATVNLPDDDSRTPLMHAVMMNNIDMAKLLLNPSYTLAKSTDAGPDQWSSTVVRRGIRRKKPVKLKAGTKRAAGLQNTFALARQLGRKKKKKEEEDDDEEEEEDEDEDKDETVFADIEDISPSDIDLSYATFPKKSNVNLKAKDCDGWSVLHHLVRSLTFYGPNTKQVHYGSWDNVQMLKLLMDAGAPIHQANSKGHVPLDDAITYGAPRLARAMQKMSGQTVGHWNQTSMNIGAVDNGVMFTGKAPDYLADSDALLEQFQKDCAAEEDRDVSFKPEPDPKLEMSDSGEVLKDVAEDVFYDVLLTKIDVKSGYWGMYNYYKMQVVHQRGKDIYVLLTRWGRIGDDGQYQRTPFATQDEAIKEFRKIFKAKSGNDWKNFKTFEKKPKKYRLVEFEERRSNKKLKELKLNLKSDIPSQLPEYVQDMLKEMTNTRMMTNTLRRMGMAEELMPFGRMKKEVLLKALGILKEIRLLVKATQEAESKTPIEDMDLYYQNLEQISKLSSEYFHLIPRDGYAYERIEPLYNEDSVQKEWKHIETLLEMERAGKILAGAQYRIKETNPLDYVYRSLGCEMALLEESSPESQYLLRYIRSSFQGKIEAIFAVSRAGEAQRLKKLDLHNHMLLFHGSSTANLISILSRGLLIAPKEAPTTGYAFGKGIYTADMFSKSAAYCYNWSNDSKSKFMLVCQVALGNVHDHYSVCYRESATVNYHSTKGCGTREPDPKYDVVLPEGALMPLGTVRTAPMPEKFTDPCTYHPCCTNNEYIVYKEEQVCLRYIVQFQG